MEREDEPLPDSLAPSVEAPAGRGRLYPSASSLYCTLTQQSTATGNQALDEELPYPFWLWFWISGKGAKADSICMALLALKAKG